LIDLSDVRDAMRAIEGEVKRTPLVRSAYLSEFCRGEVYLKLENQQTTNSFKIRGALARMKHLNAKELGVVTASAGNHAQAVAICADKLLSHATIVVPVTTPKIKIEKIKRKNVELIQHGDLYDDAEKFARQLAKERDLTFISPYNDPVVAAGQGTIGLEIMEDCPNVDSIIVPVGGGGLIAGIGTAAKNLRSIVELLGVQPYAAAAMYHSLTAGKIVDVEMRDTIADGLSGNIEKGSVTFEIIQRYVDEILLFDEDTIKKSVRLLWKREHQVAEGSGAIAIAPIISTPSRFAGKRTVSIITGGNIDEDVFEKILSAAE
jgi:threonine dehydratase